MAWVGGESYPESAERLYLAALILSDNGDHETAGHLHGVAAECALKATLERAGITLEGRRGNALYSHIPELLQSILLGQATRHLAPLLTIINTLINLMTYSIDTRYARAGSIDAARCAGWRTETETILTACGFAI